MKLATASLRSELRLCHGLSFLFAAFMTVGLVVFVSVGTPFVLNAVLRVPLAQQGRISGDLAFWSEVVLIAVFGAFGAVSDRVGRRRVYAFGLATMGVGYLLYPTVQNFGQLLACRLVYALGVGAATGMLTTVLTEYPEESSRGKLAALAGMLNGLGLVLILALFGALPSWLERRGYEAASAGRLTHALVALACFVCAAVVSFGLRDVQSSVDRRRRGLWSVLRDAAKASRNPYLALAFVCAFVARADVVILGTFSTLWGTSQALSEGHSTAEALAKGRLPMIVAESAALVFAPVVGVLLDRSRKTIVLASCFALASVGYLSVGLSQNPLAFTSLSRFALLGAGHIATLLASMTLLGREAPADTRGAVVGAFNLCGAVGILVATGVGGRLYDRIGPHTPFALAGALNVAALAAVVFVSGRYKPGYEGGLVLPPQPGGADHAA